MIRVPLKYSYAGTDISTSPLAPTSEFLKKGLSASTFSFRLARMGKLIFQTLNTFINSKWP